MSLFSQVSLRNRVLKRNYGPLSALRAREIEAIQVWAFEGECVAAVISQHIPQPIRANIGRDLRAKILRGYERRLVRDVRSRPREA